MKKSLCTLLSTIFIVCNSFVPISAEEAYSWSISQEGTQYKAEFSTDVTLSGERSVKVSCPSSKKSGSVTLTNELSKQADAGTYTFKMHYKGGLATKSVKLQLGNEEEVVIDDILDSVEDLSDNWKLFTGTVRCDDTISTLSVTLYGTCKNTIYLDELSFEDGNHENYLSDAGFEVKTSGDSGEVEATEEPNGDQKPKYETPIWSLIDTAEFAANAGNFYETTDEDCANGTKSLHISYSPSGSGKYIRLQNTTMSTPFLLANGQYEISFAIKGEYKESGIVLSTNAWEAISANGMSGEDLGNGWKKYTGTINITKNAGYLWLLIRDAANIYVDDISVKIVSTGADIEMENSGFEGVETPTDDPTGTPTEMKPTGKYTTPSWNLLDTVEFAVIESNFYETTDVDHVSGTKSLYIDYTPSANNKYIRIQNGAVNPSFTAGEYELSVCVKGSFKPHNVLLSTNQWEAIRLENMTETALENGWKKYTAKLNVTKNANRVWIQFNETAVKMFIDDITVKSVESGTISSIKNGDFEETDSGNSGEGEISEGEIGEYPSKFVGVSSDCKAYLSFKNPNNDKIIRISLFEIMNGQEKLIKDDFSTKANTSQSWESEEEQENSVHTYKVSIDFSDGESTQIVKSITVIGGNSQIIKTVDGWSFIGLTNAEIGYDTSVSHSGKASMHIVSNCADTSKYVAIRQTNLKFARDTKYEVSYWIKSKACSELDTEINWDYNVFTKDGRQYGLKTSDTEEWKKVTYIREAKPDDLSSAQFLLLMKGETEVWFDDVSVRPVNDDDSYGKDLLMNGDFEGINQELVSPQVEHLTAQGINDQISLSWKAPEKKCSRIYVYEKDQEDRWKKIADLDKSVEELTLTKKSLDKQYCYKVCPVNNIGRVGEGTEIRVESEFSEYYISDPIIEKEADKHKVICDVTLGTGKKIEMIVAVFDGEILKKIDSTQFVNDGEKVTKTLTISDVSIPTGCTVQVFWIDSRAERKPLRSAFRIK